MSEPVLTLEELIAYFDGVFNATAALKGRLAKLGPEQRAAVREVSRYQAMAKEFLDALRQTIAIRDRG